MSIISIISGNKKQLLASKPLINILHQIKTGLYHKEVEQLRQHHQSSMETAEEIRNDVIPWFSVAGHFKQRNRSLELISYSKCMLLEVFFLNKQDYQTMQEQLKANPHVLACFKNVTGTGLSFIVPTDCPMTEYTYGFWKVKSYFQEQLGINRISIKGENLEHFCRFSWDPDLYMNLDAETFTVALD